MSHPKLLIALLVFLFMLPVMAARAQGPAQTSSSDLPSIDALGPDLFLQSGSTGMVLVVVRDNQVFFRGYGETAPGSNQTPAQDSLLRLCSLTKIFTSDVLTKLVADKTVRLDDPLQHFAPRHVVVPKRVQSITLADLATHTSGLPRELGIGPHGSAHFTFPDYQTRWRWLPNQSLRSTPGTAALYSNVASTSSAMPSRPPRTNSTQPFLQSALSIRSTCSRRRSFQTRNSAAVCSSASTTKEHVP